jgi:hypothetical protein
MKLHHRKFELSVNWSLGMKTARAIVHYLTVDVLLYIRIPQEFSFDGIAPVFQLCVGYLKASCAVSPIYII